MSKGGSPLFVIEKNADALSFASGFVTSLLEHNFAQARKAIDDKLVPAEKLAGLCIVFEEGKYQGRFLISNISPSSYFFGGKVVMEVRAWLAGMRAKIGLETEEPGDGERDDVVALLEQLELILVEDVALNRGQHLGDAVVFPHVVELEAQRRDEPAQLVVPRVDELAAEIDRAAGEAGAVGERAAADTGIGFVDGDADVLREQPRRTREPGQARADDRDTRRRLGGANHAVALHAAEERRGAETGEHGAAIERGRAKS
jgi:hypothetical protein